MDTENYVSSPKPSVPSENDSLSTLVNKVKEVGVYTDELRSDLINADNGVVDLLGDGSVGKLPTNATLTQAVNKSGEVGTTFANNLNGVKGELDVVKGEVAKKMDIHGHPYKSDSYVPTWNEVTGKPGNASASSSGFMSNADKSKLDGIANNANNYVHPNDANTRHVSDNQINTWNNKSDTHSHPYKSDSYVPTWDEVSGKPSFHSVSTSGDYNSLNNKPIDCYEVLGSSSAKRYIQVQGINLAHKDCLKLNIIGSNDYDADEKTCGDYTILIKGHSSSTFSAEFVVNRDAFNIKGENIGLKDVYFNPSSKSIFVETHNVSAANGSYSKYYVMPNGKTLSLNVSMTDTLASGSSLANKINALETGLPNSSYSTSNGVKEFSSYNNMYVDNIAIQGRTKILNANNVEVSPGTSGARLVSVGQGDKIEVLTHSKQEINKVDFASVSWKNNTYIADNGTEVSLNGVNQSDYISCEPNSTYILFNANGNVTQYDSNKSFIYTGFPVVILDGSKGISYNSDIIIFNTTSKSSYIKITSVTQTQSALLLYKGAKYDKKQISTTLRSLPNGVKDEIVQQGDRYYKIVRCGEITLNGGENIEIATGFTNTIRFYIKGISNLSHKPNEVLCNSDKFVPDKNSSWNADKDQVDIQSDSININILKSKLVTQDVNGFKSWLQANPVTVVYALATPQIIEIPNPNPRTFADKTTFLLNTGVVQGEASFEVTNSLGSALEVIADKVSSLDDNTYEMFDVQLMNGYDIPEWAERPKIIKKGNMCFLHMIFAFNGTILDNIPISKIPSSCVPKSLIRNTFVVMKDNKTLIEGAFDIANDGYFRLWSANYVVDRNTTHLRVNTFWYVD